MVLSPIPLADLPQVLETFAAGLGDDRTARAALARIAAARQAAPDDVDTPAHRAAAVALAHRIGIATLDADPAEGFSWDGRVLRTRSEASVVVHEIAHWLVCPPERRHLLDFGLGGGPETGRRAEADAMLCVGMETGQEEEALASLLGILWEAAIGLPAILAFQEQNWLEGYDRPAAPAYFRRTLGRLVGMGLVDADGGPRVPASALQEAAHG